MLIQTTVSLDSPIPLLYKQDMKVFDGKAAWDEIKSTSTLPLPTHEKVLAKLGVSLPPPETEEMQESYLVIPSWNQDPSSFIHLYTINLKTYIQVFFLHILFLSILVMNQIDFNIT